MIKLERILQQVEQAKNIPNSYIEYNGELPNISDITPDSFFGIPAKFNKDVSTHVGCSVVFKY